MEIRVDNPGLHAEIDRWTSATGRPPDELVEDALAGYFEELAQTQAMLDRRYDDLKSGRAQAIDGEEAFARLQAKTEAERKRRA